MNVTSSLSEKALMPNQFDPHRDALVVEKHTVEQMSTTFRDDRSRIENSSRKSGRSIGS